MRNKILILLIPLALSVLYACANTTSVAKVHPGEVTGLQDCAGCHADAWGAMNHKTADFYSKHRFYAASSRQACASCHQESFCSDCHAHKEEIKPSDKFTDSPERSLPHRGDYLSQHKIDGRINPVSCAKCHGRQNNERCAICHK
jgi:hypothetical protein